MSLQCATTHDARLSASTTAMSATVESNESLLDINATRIVMDAGTARLSPARNVRTWMRRPVRPGLLLALSIMSSLIVYFPPSSTRYEEQERSTKHKRRQDDLPPTHVTVRWTTHHAPASTHLSVMVFLKRLSVAATASSHSIHELFESCSSMLIRSDPFML